MRIVIAEDQFLLRDGLTRMLEAHGIEIGAAVDNGDDLVAAVTADPPDVAIVDVRLPPTFTDEGIRAALAVSALSRARARCSASSRRVVERRQRPAARDQ